jgi:ferredoxin
VARALQVAVSGSCVASGTCRRLLPGVFGAGEDRRAVVLLDPVPEDDALLEALESCPVEALSARNTATGEPVFP